MPSLIFRKGLDLKDEVAGELKEDYHSGLVDRVKGSTYRYTSGRLTVYLAREFGFCYGVDRAVDYAYQTRRRFPNRLVYLTGEIIHNAHVNGKLRAAGIRFLSDPGVHADQLDPDAVVILPAFGVGVAELERYDRLECTVIDTTCGSVLNVWNKVREHARDGFTAVIRSPRRDACHGLADADGPTRPLSCGSRSCGRDNRLRLYPQQRRGASVPGVFSEGDVRGLRSGP